jgi:uncharacterized protein (DUF2147 family)
MRLPSSLKFVPKITGALVVAGAMLTASYATANHPLGNPDGYWVTIHDDGVTKKSILKIFTYKDQIYGKVHALLQKPQDSLCKECKGSQHCKPIKGMLIMRNLKWNEGKQRWDEGKVTDPESGKSYWLNIKYNNARGTEIQAKGSIDRRGYIGRKQKWLWCDQQCVAREVAKATPTGADNGECVAE